MLYINVQELFAVFLILCFAAPGLSSATISFNVMNYGAVGDGKTDDSAAFLKAWKAVCQTGSGIPILIIPAGKTFLLKPVTFSGPCKPSHIYVRGVTCKGPTALTFYRCNGLVVKGLRHTNSQRNHITISGCNGAKISNLHISAPSDSPNTDGIDIASSTNIRISNSFIGTGDDCIAISSGSSNINISGIDCGPGHGISIGALGVHGEQDTVEEVHVRNCTFKATMNGVRIKTWQGGSGYARKITFEKIKFVNTGNPIVIDQYYCPSGGCQNETTTFKISDVSYNLITGTSSTEKVINFSCDKNVGCNNIVLDHVYVTASVAGKMAYAYCYNAQGRLSHTKPSVKCLLS
ncbi:hypothetical protein SLEP1_g44047 [Rubroshorea leprosula]|uniref:Polygalacturonase n=1 Tax=Rubroshorea leprosula TaxID=152421 RepID=A0AAV5LEZ4_9ROSI|nr:hypothetical protein SLEP1_g44047 [Rubroshorea leprosula]